MEPKQLIWAENRRSSVQKGAKVLQIEGSAHQDPARGACRFEFLCLSSSRKRALCVRYFQGKLKRFPCRSARLQGERNGARRIRTADLLGAIQGGRRALSCQNMLVCSAFLMVLVRLQRVKYAGICTDMRGVRHFSRKVPEMRGAVGDAATGALPPAGRTAR